MLGHDERAQRRAAATRVLALAERNAHDELALEVRNLRTAAAEELGDVTAMDHDLAALEAGATRTRRPFLQALARMRAA